MMVLETPLNQADYLTDHTPDPEVCKGVCLPVTVEWVLAHLTMRGWSWQRDLRRGIAQQRGYLGRAYLLTPEHYAAARYPDLLRIDRVAVASLVRESAVRVGLVHTVEHLHGAGGLLYHLLRLSGRARGVLFSLYGTDPSDPADTQNWGHTMGLVMQAPWRFVDVNYGQYGWAPGASDGLRVYDVVRAVLRYQVLGLRNLDVHWFR